LPEKDVRDAAQIVILQKEFTVERRVCYSCSRADEALVTKPIP
jgi:hypothetical protein